MWRTRFATTSVNGLRRMSPSPSSDASNRIATGGALAATSGCVSSSGVVTVGSWVVHAVCEIVADVVDIVVALAVGLWNIVAGIFTWNWGRVWDGLVGIVSAIVGFATDISRIVTLGDLVGFFRDSANTWRLRNHVRDLIDHERRFSEDERKRIKAALGIDEGGFGFRLRVRALRGFARSDQVSPGSAIPDLVAFNNDPNPDTRVDLKLLTGFASTTFWQ